MRSLLPLSLLLLAACSGGGETAASAPVAQVKTARAETGNAQSVLRVYGASEAGDGGLRILSAPIEAQVVAVLAQPGTRVARGTVIARLRPSAASALDLAKAGSEARFAAGALARMKRLRGDGLASDADVDSARSAADSAALARSSLSARSAALILRAPVNGYVTVVSFNPGDTVAAGASFATITPGGDIRARFGIDPEEARLVKPGDAMAVRAASGGARFTVAVRSVDARVDPVSRLAAVYAVVPASARIGAGEPLLGEISLVGMQGVPLIPYVALLDDGGQPYVFVVEKGIARRRNVETGAASSGKVAVLSGIKSGDVVVTEGGTGLEDGVKVASK